MLPGFSVQAHKRDPVPNEQWLAFNRHTDLVIHGYFWFSQKPYLKHLICFFMCILVLSIWESFESSVDKWVGTVSTAPCNFSMSPDVLICSIPSPYPSVSSPGDYPNYSGYISSLSLKQPCFNAEKTECGRNHFNEVTSGTKISYTCELVLVFYMPTFSINVQLAQCNQIRYCAVTMYYALALQKLFS